MKPGKNKSGTKNFGKIRFIRLLTVYNFIMANKKDPHAKLTIQEYLQLQEKEKKRRFKPQLYPWPVTLALAIPAGFFVLILIFYIFHINGVAG